MDGEAARLADVGDAGRVAELLDAFNREFDAPTPGPAALASRLERLLVDGTTFAVLAGHPAVGTGVVTLRPNLWSDGPVALLDELFVLPEYRSRGFGAELLALAMAAAVERGAAAFEVEVDEPDLDAQRFYARHGLPLRDAVTGDRALVLRRDL